MTRFTSCCLALLSSVAAAGLLAQVPAAGSLEEEARARRLFELGLELMSKGDPTEALRRFNDVVTGYARSSAADDALVAIATYHIDVSHDGAAAKNAVETLLAKYRGSDSEAMGYVLTGRLKLMGSRSAATVASVLSDFETVGKVYGDTDALPAAYFYAGEAQSLARKHVEAIQHYQRVVTEYPGSEWAARSSLGAARAFVQLDQSDPAMAVLQRMRLAAAAAPEAAHALSWNTVLYRLHVRGSGQRPAYEPAARVLAGPTTKLKDVVALGIDRNQAVYAVQKNGTSVFDVSGKIVRNIPGVNPSAIFFGPNGRAVIVQRSGFQPDDEKTPLPLAAPKPGNTPRALEEIPAAVMTSARELLVTDREAKAIARFTLSGKHVGIFSQGQADRLAINWLDDVAVLDRDAKSVSVLGHDDKQIHRFQPRGAGYEFRNPVDIAFDALGNLYVLDRGGDRSAVYVFSPRGRLITTYRPAPKTAGVFQEPVALALDGAGRLYIYDERNERVQVYQ